MSRQMNAARVHLRPKLLRLAYGVSDRRLTIIRAPGGAGKTTLARAWQAELWDTGIYTGWITLSESHCDLHSFLDDCLAAIRDALRGDSEASSFGGANRFGESLERLMSLKTELDPKQMLRRLTIELRAQSPPPIVCLDAFEHLREDSAPFEIIDAILRLEPCPVRLIVTTRGRRPSAFAGLLAAGDAFEVEGEELELRAAQIADVLLDENVAPDPEIVAGLLGRTQGWAMAIRLMAGKLARTSAEMRPEVVRRLSEQTDLLDYIGSELVGRGTPDVLEILETAARMGPAPSRLLIAAANPDRDRQAGLRESIDKGLLLPDGADLALHDLWREWLRSPLREIPDAKEEARIRRRMGEALEACGEPARAIEQYRVALPDSAAEDCVARLLSENGHAWLSVGQRSIVKASLSILPEKRIRDVPSLSALEGLYLAGSDPEQAIAHCERACEGYREAGDLHAEAMCLHELGVIAINENRGDVVRKVRKRAITVARAGAQYSLRGMLLMALGFAVLASRRFTVALRLLQAAETYEHHPRERGGIVIVQATILFYQGRWDETQRRISALLARPEQRQHGSSFLVLLVYQAMIDSSRGIDSQRHAARFEEASEYFERCHHTNNRIRTEQAYGAHLLRTGEPAMALQHFELAEALGRRISLWEAVGAAAGASARLHQLLGEPDRARRVSEEALAQLDREKVWSEQPGFAHACAPGILLACLVFAESGDAKHAASFLGRHRRRLEWPEMPMCEHMRFTVKARILELQGDNQSAVRAIREAWQIAESSALDGFAPELDEGLLRASVEFGRRAGHHGPVFERACAEVGLEEQRPILLQTLGGLHLTIEGRAVPDRSWRGNTTRRLLARLLIADRQRLARGRLESELWPEASGANARANLRAALFRLRDVLEPRRRRPDAEALVLVEGEEIGLASPVVEAWDVGRLREAFESARRAVRAGSRVRMVRALAAVEDLDRGAFWPGIDDEWILTERTAFEIERAAVGNSLAEQFLASGETELARRSARQVLRHHVEEEESWSIIVRSLIAEDDFAAARRALAEGTARVEAAGETAGRQLLDLAELL